MFIKLKLIMLCEKFIQICYKVTTAVNTMKEQ